MYPPIVGVHLKKDQQKTYLMMRCFFLLFFSGLLYKSICYGYSFELHRQVNEFKSSNHNICLNKEVAKSTLVVI